jgi:hypothetical protein
MIGAGLAGSLVGLQAGILFWLCQRVTGETVEEKWAREFAFNANQRELNEAKRKAKDQRAEKLGIVRTDISPAVEDGSSESEAGDEYVWMRTLVMKLREVALSLGLITDDSFGGEKER